MAIKVLFSGKSSLLFADCKCSQDQLKRIVRLAKFAFENSVLLEPLSYIFKVGFKDDWFVSSFPQAISTIGNMFEIPESLFNEFKELLTDFYQNSNEISNDRAKVVETICDFGMKKKIPVPLNGTKYHCKVEVSYDSTIFNTGENDIDICVEKDTGSNSVEAKMGIEARLDEAVQRKFKVFTNLVGHFNAIREATHDHLLRIVVFTINDSKLEFIKQTWPDLEFIGVKDFALDYCS